jgi:tetratricopeptide (TPR) repeat protein
MVAERKIAQELDPVSLTTNFAIGLTFYYGRNYDQAIEQFQKTLELDPSFPPVRIFLPAAYEQQGKFDQAIAEFQKGLDLKEGGERYLLMAGLGHAYALSGKQTEALAVLKELKQNSQQRHVPGDSIAIVYVGLGEKDQALVWLEEAYKQHSFQIQFIKLEPRWDDLRSDPRFVDLTRRLKLPQ